MHRTLVPIFALGALMVASTLLAQPEKPVCASPDDVTGTCSAPVPDCTANPGHPYCIGMEDMLPGYAGASCTANDVSVVLVGLGVQQDGCVNQSDTVLIDLQATLEANATTRYDIAWFLPLTAAGTGRTGLSQPAYLYPVASTATHGGGLPPYDDADGDFCGEILSVDNPTTFDYPFPVELSCAAVGGGFLAIPRCVVWAQSNGRVCSNISQTGTTNAFNSKCNCAGTTATNIPGPNLQCGVASADPVVAPGTIDPDDPIATIGVMECRDNGDGAAPLGHLIDDSLGPGETATCTVRYRNTATCTPAIAPPYANADQERFQCGTVGFVQFDISYNTDRGTVIGFELFDDDANVVAGEDEVLDDLAGVLRWTPVSNTGLPNGRGIVRPNGDAGVLNFTYQANLDNTGTQNIAFNLSTYWSNAQAIDEDDAFTTRVLQELPCTASLTTTPVTLGFFRADRDGGSGGTEITWVTSTEAGNAGFNLYGKVRGSWVKLNADVIPSQTINSTTPTSYRFATAESEATEFRLEEIDLRGRARPHGSFHAGRSYGDQSDVRAIDWSAVRAELDRVVDRGRGLVRVASDAKTKPNQAASPSNGSGPVDLLVTETGLHRVTYEALLEQGFDFAKVQSVDLALSAGGQQVPIRVVAGKFFAPGSYFEFWGDAADTIYTGTNVYRLEVAKKTGLRIAVESSAPGAGVGPAAYQETVEVATNKFYSLMAPGPDPFVISQMQAFGAQKTYNFPLAVDGLVPGGGPETLHVELWGASDYGGAEDHHVRVLLNGVQVADEIFEGITQKQIDVPVSGLLVEGANTLTIVQPGDLGLPTDTIVLESYGATYPRSPVARDGALRLGAASSVVEVGGLPSANGVVYRLGASGPVFLSGVSFAADGGTFSARFAGDPAGASYVVADSSALRQPGLAPSVVVGDLLSGEARYLVITHPAFENHLGSLVAARQAQGYTVDVVNVGEIYAAYSHGVTDANAIRSYIADAARQRGTELVLLVGGDTYDYRNFVGNSVSFVPSLYAATGDFVRHAPVDPLYADVDGDGVPDLGIGRFPVRTVQELGYIIDKTLTYESKSYQNVASFAADRFDNAGNISFESESDQFLAGMPGDWTATKTYLQKFATAAEARAALTASINAGAALTGYFGHSGPSAWTFSGLFRNVDAINLTNVGSPTVVMQWGCWNTYHVQPQFNTLGHNWLVAGYQGAAAVLGSSTLVEDSHARALSAYLAPLIAQPGVPIGIAVVEAKQQLAARRGGVEDVQLGWSLLGDPALVVTP
jgi:hypothetical protein